jgi:CheY-like chemotaxis protein
VPRYRRRRRGLDLLESARPDLLLTDLQMPEIDGMALLRRALELDPAPCR